jgi:hypothetical protein
MVSPSLTAVIHVSRHPGFYLLNAFLLMFLNTLMSFSAFCISAATPHFRLAVTLTILLTAINFKWVVNRSLPPTSTVNRLDTYHIFSVSFICFLAAWHSLIATRLFALLEPRHCAQLDMAMLLAFAIVFILFQVGIYVRFSLLFRACNTFYGRRKFFSMLQSRHFRDLLANII